LQQLLGGDERLLALGRQGETLAAAVLDEFAAVDQPSVCESGQQLGDRRPGHAGAVRELRAGQPFGRDRPQRQELRHRQRRLVTSE
jgi:hypothetical protein